MQKMQLKPLAIAVGLALGGIASLDAVAAIGPSTEVSPYIVPSAGGVDFTSVLTVGDAVRKKYKGNESYRMVGIPDGLGAFDNGDGTITLLMNHELGSTAGVPRAHGGIGSFISRWQIRKADLAVLNGADLIRRVYLSSGGEYVETSGAVFNRFCSADLAAKSAFYNPGSDLGFGNGYIFMNGEESGQTGRAFAHVVQGLGNSATYELPALGNASWENVVASPHPQDLTVVAGLDDGGGSSKVYFYVGTKQAEGNPIEQAGLTNGTRYEIAISGIGNETGIAQGDTAAKAFTLAAGAGTGFNRVEDGAWSTDAEDPNTFYFVTTASFAGNSRLWQVTFTDIENPTAGGTIRVLVDGALRGPKMMDNLTVDGDGKVLIQEDPGNQSYIAKVWSYDPATDSLVEIAQFDPDRFTPGVSAFITQDEESSGIIEVTSLFEGVAGYEAETNRYFLLDAQVHKNIAATEPELVEMGQLLFMSVPK